jgi:hypothetical protein
MNKNKALKTILLLTLIVTVLIAAAIDVPNGIRAFRVAMSGASASDIAAGSSGAVALIGQIMSWFNIALFIFIIFFYKYKKLNLLWILLPYLGSLIFGFSKLLEKAEVIDEGANNEEE